MKKLLARFLISKVIVTHLSKESVKKTLSESNGNGFKIRNINKDKYKFLANFSFGTAIAQGGPGLIDGISIYGQVLDGPNSTTIVQLSTRMRVELILILIVWIVLIILQIIGNEIPIWVSLVLFPIIFLWFGFIYRLQENSLLKKVEKTLKTPYNNA